MPSFFFTSPSGSLEHRGAQKWVTSKGPRIYPPAHYGRCHFLIDPIWNNPNKTLLHHSNNQTERAQRAGYKIIFHLPLCKSIPLQFPIKPKTLEANLQLLIGISSDLFLALALSQTVPDLN